MFWIIISSEIDSTKIPSYLRDNPAIELDNIRVFEEEIADLEAQNPLIVSFGVETYKILKKNFVDKYKIVKIPHYAKHISKEDYRNDVSTILKGN